MSVFIHPQGICESKDIGEKTRIWAFTHVLPNAKIGKNCNVCDHVFIENDVVIGDNVTVKCGVQLWDGITIEDNVFIGPNVTFTNDKFPRSKVYPESFARTIIKKNASIGANATLLPGITIHENAMIGAGSVVVKSVPPNAIVVGNPAKIIGYTDTIKNTETILPEKNSSSQKNTQVKNVTLHHLPVITDLRGSLSVGEFPKQIPFIPKRYFLVFDVESSEIRGEHAHKKCQQFLICIKGSCSVVADDGKNREEFKLDAPNIGLYLPPMTWGIQYRYSSDAVLLVFASEFYDAEDYIRDYQEFQQQIIVTDK
jgi:UDP-2-acetamido-3-amino-2,3-dideoxy-glucuronate N-acetyltransferase